jgi:hypothetical protein
MELPKSSSRAYPNSRSASALTSTILPRASIMIMPLGQASTAKRTISSKLIPLRMLAEISGRRLKGPGGSVRVRRHGNILPMRKLITSRNRISDEYDYVIEASVRA